MAVSHGSTGDVMTPNQSKLLKIIWMTIACTQLPFSCFLPCNKPALLLLLFNRFVHITFVSFVVFSLEKTTKNSRLIFQFFFSSAWTSHITAQKSLFLVKYSPQIQQLKRSPLSTRLSTISWHLKRRVQRRRKRMEGQNSTVAQVLFPPQFFRVLSARWENQSSLFFITRTRQGTFHLVSVASVAARVRPSVSLGGNACYNIYITTYVYTVCN